MRLLCFTCRGTGTRWSSAGKTRKTVWNTRFVSLPDYVGHASKILSLQPPYVKRLICLHENKVWYSTLRRQGETTQQSGKRWNGRESNPDLLHGKIQFYHWITSACWRLKAHVSQAEKVLSWALYLGMKFKVEPQSSPLGLIAIGRKFAKLKMRQNSSPHRSRSVVEL